MPGNYRSGVEVFMIIVELLAIIAAFLLLIVIITNFLEKKAKRQFIALIFVAVFGYLINTGALIYNIVLLKNTTVFDYFAVLIKGAQYTASLLVFEDKFNSLGALTAHNWFKIIYYVFLGCAYILYSLTLISLLSYKTLSKIKLLFTRSNTVYCFSSINDKSLMLADSVAKEKPGALIVFTLINLSQDDETKKTLKKLKNRRFYIYVCSRESENEDFLEKYPLLSRFKRKLLFCLDENSEKNISFCKDYSNDPIEIYAMAEEEFCGSSYLNKSNIHIIKQHDLTARMLVNAYPCYNNIYCDNEKKHINVIILGRGRSGNAIFKNIFVANQFKDVNLNITVFDAKDKNGFYKLQYPGIYDNENIKFLKTDIYSENFLEEFFGFLRKDNYIVVALGDDKKNIELANIIYKYILTQSNYKASIYVHIRHEKNKTLLQDVLKDGISIHAIGTESQIFNYDIVVGEFMDIFAKAINDNYNKANPANAKNWCELSEFTKSSNRSVGVAAKSKMFSLGLEIADMNDEREEFDINLLSEEDNLKAAMEEHMRWNAFHLVNGWNKMTIEESMAYGKDKKVRKSEDKKKSLSLVEWDELDNVSKYLGEDIKSYDYLWKNAFVEALHKYNKKIVEKE